MRIENFTCVVRSTAFLLAVVVGAMSSAFAQGNSVSGFVWGPGRTPIPDVMVELQNEMYVTVQRTRTDHSGGYKFFNAPSGRLRVRVSPQNLGFEPQEIEFEIVNFARDNGAGGLRRSGFSNEQHSFHLRPKKGAEQAAAGVVFAQEVPPEAQKLYLKAIDDLANQKEREGLDGLKSALEIFPKYYLALDRLGNEYVRLKHYGAAEVLLSIAADVNPKSYRSWYGLAYARYSLRRFSEAIPAAEKAEELQPDSAESSFLLGSSLRQSKRVAEAEKALVKARSLPNSPALVHWELALLYANDMKRYADAADELKAFIKAQPDTKDAELIKQLIAEFETKSTAAAKSNL
jgi:tetratricopeptide (TPR) repeat protein